MPAVLPDGREAESPLSAMGLFVCRPRPSASPTVFTVRRPTMKALSLVVLLAILLSACAPAPAPTATPVPASRPPLSRPRSLRSRPPRSLRSRPPRPPRSRRRPRSHRRRCQPARRPRSTGPRRCRRARMCCGPGQRRVFKTTFRNGALPSSAARSCWPGRAK